MEIGIIVLIIFAVIALCFVFLQRKLVHAGELCENAMSSIGVQLTSRWDAVTSLVKLTEKYSAHEKELLEKVVGMRRPLSRTATAQEVQAQENAIGQAVSHIMAVSESYPELKSNALYLNAMDSLKEYENQVRMSRMVYNDTITKYNRTIKMFPNNIIAGLMGFEAREYFEADQTKADMPVI